jgi:hypothetical protein
MKENQMRKKTEKEVNNLFESQSVHFNGVLGQTQSDHNKNRLDNEKDTEDLNIKLTADKKQRELDQHAHWADLEKKECEFIANSEFINESPITQVNSLGGHRVKPYHFKGFNEEKREKVYNEREIQLKEQEMMKKQAQDEDRQFARQQE